MSNQIKILFVEDDIIDQVAFKRYVIAEKLPYDYVFAHSRVEATHILTSQTFDAVVSDYNLGDGTAYDLLASPYLYDTPVIVVTGVGDEETAVRILKSGASDYLIKDENRNYLKMLPTTISQAILNKEREVLISKLHQVVEQSPGIIVLMDLDGNIEYVNNKFLEITEYNSLDILGKNMILISPEDKYYEIREALTKGNVWRGEILSTTKTGKQFWELTTYSPIRNKEGRIVNYMKISEDVTLRRRMEEQLRHLANTDILTGVYNRRAGLLLLETQMKQAKRGKTLLTIGFIDVNDLKNVNDKYGHNEGDELIKAVSNGIAQVLRSSDTLCRLGGDEFLIILPRCTREQAEQTWLRVNDIFNYHNAEKSRHYKISASFGFIEYSPDNDMLIDELISQADQEMYKCKQEYKKKNSI